MNLFERQVEALCELRVQDVPPEMQASFKMHQKIWAEDWMDLLKQGRKVAESKGYDVSEIRIGYYDGVVKMADASGAYTFEMGEGAHTSFESYGHPSKAMEFIYWGSRRLRESRGLREKMGDVRMSVEPDFGGSRQRFVIEFLGGKPPIQVLKALTGALGKGMGAKSPTEFYWLFNVGEDVGDREQVAMDALQQAGYL